MTAAKSSPSRRQAREYALLALYRSDMAEEESGLTDLWAALVDGEGIPDLRAPESEEVEFAQRLVRGVSDHRDKIDELIESCSTNWRVRRMPLVDRNLIRIAAFELMYCPDIPGSVSCNEAIELAKRYGTAESRAFVNGIVDRVGHQLKRLPERHRSGGAES